MLSVVSCAKQLNRLRCHMGCCVGWTQGTRYYMGFRSPMGRGDVEGEGRAWWHSDVNCAKMAEPIEMPFELWTLVGPRKHVLDGDADPRAKGQF